MNSKKTRMLRRLKGISSNRPVKSSQVMGEDLPKEVVSCTGVEGKMSVHSEQLH